MDSGPTWEWRHMFLQAEGEVKERSDVPMAVVCIYIYL